MAGMRSSIGGGEPLSEEMEAAGLRIYADELRDAFLRMNEEALTLHEQGRAVRVTEKSLDGLVAATVGARGELLSLDIDPRVFRRPDSRHLADTITETVNKAAAKAREQVVEIFEPLIPADQMRAHIDGDVESVLEQMVEQIRGER
jgi:DNA-binding protein YbaB